jgi:hypothetical protein
MIDWLINYLLFYVPLKNFSLIWRRHHCQWRAANLGLCSVLRAFEQGGIFIVPHLLWHGTSFFPVSSEGPPHLVASYDTRRGCEGSILTRILMGNSWHRCCVGCLSCPDFTARKWTVDCIWNWKRSRYLAAHTEAAGQGQGRAWILPVLHRLIGCDSLSVLRRRLIGCDSLSVLRHRLIGCDSLSVLRVMGRRLRGQFETCCCSWPKHYWSCHLHPVTYQ